MDKNYDLTIIQDESVPMAAGIPVHTGLWIAVAIILVATAVFAAILYIKKCKQYQSRLQELLDEVPETDATEVSKWNIYKLQFQVENLENLAATQMYQGT